MKHFRQKLAILLIFCLLIPFHYGDAASLDRERYIVVFDPSHDEIISSIEDDYIYEKYDVISAVAVLLTEKQVQLLSQSKYISSITPDQVMKVEAQSSDWGIGSTKSDVAHRQGKTGKGVKIAILDTGIDSGHPDLKIAGGTCFNANQTATSSCRNGYSDVNGHGTHVAGIIGAQNNNIGTIGIAYDAEIYAVKVLDDEGNGLSSTVLKGMDWAIKQKMDIINLSLSSAESNPALKAIIDSAYNQGMLVVAAAGNSGNKTGTGDTVGFPSRYESVISVAAVTKSQERALFSATGSTVEVAAPGDLVYSTIPGGKYALMSGTSMATPYVSGMLALYKEQFPTKTNIELRQMLQQNVKDLGAAGRDPKFGYGLIQANTEEKVVDNQMLIERYTEKGTVIFHVKSFPEGVSSYDVYRDGKLIDKGVTSTTWTEFLLKGTYQYQFKHSKGMTEMVATIHEPYFSDLYNEDWFADELVFLNKNDIIRGYEGNRMKPRQNITRAEALVMLGRAIGLNGSKRLTVFSDVHEDSSVSGYIQSAYENGIITGYPDHTFRPSQYVTRAEMAIVLSNAYKLSASPKTYFSDVPTSVTGYQAIYNLAYHKITQGFIDGTFRPYDKINRSAFAVFVARAENDMFKEEGL